MNHKLGKRRRRLLEGVTVLACLLRNLLPPFVIFTAAKPVLRSGTISCRPRFNWALNRMVWFRITFAEKTGSI